MKDKEKELLEPTPVKTEVIEKVDILDQGIQRFGISGMSKDRVDEAVNEEIILEKNIGEFLLKNKDGAVISIDSINRQMAAFNNAVHLAELTGICGNIYLVEDNNRVMPFQVEFGKNFLTEPIELPEGINKCLLNLDYSEYVYNKTSGFTDNVNVESKVEVIVNEKTYLMTINEMNRLVIKDVAPMRITSIKFIQDDQYIGIADMKGVLSNIFITINKEVE